MQESAGGVSEDREREREREIWLFWIHVERERQEWTSNLTLRAINIACLY